tara:strand:- start:406 stop:654 length:249 start_codon:yes stop_codon:yes gene_type:complete
MKKLSEALQELGLDQSFFDELKADLEAERIVTENGLIATSKEDVEDEYNQLHTKKDEDEVDETDENEIDMSILSPTMRAVYK